MEVNYADGIAEYQTNVFVQKKENYDLYCDRAKLFFITEKALNSTAKASTGNIKKIELYDNITIVKGPKIAKGDFGTIYPKEKLIILTGKVALKEKTKTKEQYLEGTEVKYYIDKGIFKVKNDTTTSAGAKGRVKIIVNEATNKK